MEVREFLNRRKHPFYEHGDAAQFIALRGGEAVGRILASDDSLVQPASAANRWAASACSSRVEDRAVAHALLDAAAGWLSARGRNVIRGPVDYSTNYQCGLLVEGFDTPPRIMMNHNRRYYAELLESWGLRKAKDLYAWWFVDPHDLISQWQSRVDRLARRSGVTVRPFRKNDFAAEVDRCQEVYNAAMKELWGFVTLTRGRVPILRQASVPNGAIRTRYCWPR